LLEAETKRWRLEARDLEAAQRLMEELGAPHARIEGRVVVVEMGAVAPEHALRALVERGIAVVSFAPREPSLEEIYLRYAAAERSSPAESPARPSKKPAPESVASAALTAPPESLAPRHGVLRMTAFDLRRVGRSLGVVSLLAAPAIVGAAAMLHRAAQGTENAQKVAG